MAYTESKYGVCYWVEDHQACSVVDSLAEDHHERWAMAGEGT